MLVSVSKLRVVSFPAEGEVKRTGHNFGSKVRIQGFVKAAIVELLKTTSTGRTTVRLGASCPSFYLFS